MAKSNAEKQERNDVYTAFVVLGLFVVFGFFITRLNGAEEVVDSVWVEKPESPSGYLGYPYPHDDESIERQERVEEALKPLQKRSIRPVVSTEPVAQAVNSVVPVSDAPVTVIASEPKVEEMPITEQLEETVEAVEEAVVKEEPVVEAPVVEKPAPVVESKPKPVVKKPKPVAKPKPPSSTVVKGEAGMNYITSDLPCVWVVGIFKNPSNVNRVVGRLRLNKFDVGTGPHEKGTYVGVPCACEANDAKQAQLREIFAAQPWMLRK